MDVIFGEDCYIISCNTFEINDNILSILFYINDDPYRLEYDMIKKCVLDYYKFLDQIPSPEHFISFDNKQINIEEENAHYYVYKKLVS